MTLSPGPPPWPIPPSWTLTPPGVSSPQASPPAAPEPEHVPAAAAVPASPPVAEPARAVPERPGTPAVVVLAMGGAETHDVLGAVPGVTVTARPIPVQSPGFAGVYELAEIAAQAAHDAGGGVVITGADAPEETAWVLELLHQGELPLVLAADPRRDVADAIAVAAAVPAGSGCLLVANGEIHSARHVRRTGERTSVSPDAGPLGHVRGGAARLLWRPPGRLTVSVAANGGTNPRVGLHTTALGDDGLLLGALAEHCDGLVVTATATGGVSEEIAAVLTEASARIPVILTAPHGHVALPSTTLHPLKARILMHLLLSTGRDRESVLTAFATAERPGPARL